MSRVNQLSRIVLIVLAATALEAAPWSSHRDSYDLDQFLSDVEGVEVGSYSAISNSARLVAAYDEGFDPIGLIEGRGKDEVFRVGTPVESYSWYRGINDKRTTVGFTLSWDDFAVSGWIRDHKGNVRTFGDPAGDVYLYHVNNKDVAVGEVVYGFGFFRPALVDRHGLAVVDPAGVDPDHPAYFSGINDAGAIVGGTYDPGTSEHTCLLWNRCGVTTISHEGASLVAPRAINNRGQIAGFWIESELDPLIGERAHGFIRDPDGTFRTVDIEYPFEEEVDFGDPEPAVLVDQTTKILDMNDRGEIVIEATAWYLARYEYDGETFEDVLPLWTYAVGTPARCSGGRGRRE